MKIKLLLLLLSILTFSFCKSAKVDSPTQFEKKSISFGKGGGFTGMTTSFVLLQNGQLFKQEKDTNFVLLKTIPAKEVKALFKEITTQNIATTKLNAPGNMSYFIQFEDKKNDLNNRITWGDAKNPVEGNIKDFYKKLMSLVAEPNDEGKE